MFLLATVERVQLMKKAKMNALQKKEAENILLFNLRFFTCRCINVGRLPVCLSVCLLKTRKLASF